MADRIEELRKRGMITSLAKVPGDKTDSIICAATLADAAADPALTLDIARELLREAAEAIRRIHQYRERKKSMADHTEMLRGLVSAAVRKVTGWPDLRAGELSLVSEICAAIDDAMLKAREASND